MRDRTASAVVVVALLGAWAWFLMPQVLGGRAAYILVSGRSMLPHYRSGDVVLVERQSAYHVGDVVAYHVPKGDPMAGAEVIHRIVGGDGVHGFLMQGDNRTAPDVWRPKTGDIVGAKELRLPHALVVMRFLRAPLTLALLAACFVFAHVALRESEGGAVAPPA